MHKIADFMMSKKFIPVIIALTAISLFFTYQSQGKNDNDDNPRIRYAKILRNVGVLLEDGHYSPKKIDDAFSKEILKKFTEELDDEKNIFLQSDISGFQQYADKIDDEIHGAEINSFFDINDVYLKRVNEVSQYYKELLAKPFDFNLDENVILDPEKSTYPKSENERKDTWRKRLKYGVLSKYVDLQEDREKNKDKKDFKVKPDSTLEREARDHVRRQMDRYFTTKKTRENMDANFSTFVNSITGNMDPHTNYLPPIDLRSFNESMSGRFFGIGAQLKEDDGKIKISSLVSGGPAWKSGELKENDEIIKVGQGKEEPVDVTGYAVSDAVKLIRGSQKGTEVRLTVKRIDGTEKVVVLIRDDIKLEDTFAKSAIIKTDNKIGYIYLPEFYADFDRPNGARCAVDVAKEIEKLKLEKVDGIILDLRGNGGGSLFDVVQMAGLFIKDGPICQVKGRDAKANILPDKNSGILYDGPLAVMVDGTSASASEIFAAAIQDYQRGVIIGSSSTYGKGTVQRNISLTPEAENSLLNAKSTEDLGSVKLTLQKFYRISGGSTQLRGVTPDIVLPDRYDYLKFREKDSPDALKWDEISKAPYSVWTSTPSSNLIITEANDDVKKNMTFEKLRTNIQWLEKYYGKSYSINIRKYKEEQKELKSVSKQIDELTKLPVPIKITNLDADTANIVSAEDKVEKNKQWLKFRSTDIYLDQSVKVLNKMIIQNNMARAETTKPEGN
ncbi:MAG: carboxy terminal-processing peptidase [Sphingobacteriales bacterium]|nr:carboxy terminal-processing peptidase [Sphingobacteriales bacterium]